MDPSQRNLDLPSRPKFSWDSKNVPWTDGMGPQQRYAESVAEWIPDDLIHSDDEAKHIVAAIYQQDTICVLTAVFEDYNALISARRGDNEAYKNFENRFSALVSKFNSHSTSISISEPLLAFLLLHSANLSDHQRISILASVSSKQTLTKPDCKNIKSDSDTVSEITYESVAGILHQCERDRPRAPGIALGAHSGHVYPRRGRGGGGRRGGGRGGRRMTASELKIAKGTQAFHACKAKGIDRYRHWATDHNPDGSIDPKFPSHIQPLNAQTATTPASAQQDIPKDVDNSRPKTTMGFMASLSSSIGSASTADFGNRYASLGPLVDDGAPFSAIGETELNLICNKLIFPTPPTDPKPAELSNYELWKYGSGDHSSPAKSILGSVEIFVRAASGRLVSVRHLLIHGSSSWVIGRNVTAKCTLEHITDNVLLLPGDSRDSIPMTNDRFHSFIPIDRFTTATNQVSPPVHTLTCASAPPTRFENADWPTIRRFVDRVHRHVCGQATYSDMRTLLSRKKISSPSVQEYLSQKVKECTHCRASSTPPPNRRVSLATLDSAFNEVLRIDHVHLYDNILLHMMDSASGFSASHAVPNTDMGNTVYAIECVWLSQFWTPQAIHADGAFQNCEFRTFLDTNGISLRPDPPLRHQKNACEPRNRIIRSIFILLRQADHVTSTSINVIRAVLVSNDLYGNDIASAFELAKGFTRSIDSKTINPLPPELQQSHLDILARRKLNLILRSHAPIQNRLRKGDLVQVFIKNSSDKRGTWTSPRQIFEINAEAGCISVHGRAGKLVRAAFEDVRIAPKTDTLDEKLQSAIDDLDESIDDILLTTSSLDSSKRYNDTAITFENDNIGYDSPDPVGLEDNDDDGDEASHPPGDFTADQPAQPTVGARIQIYWPLDDKLYDGEITNVDTNGMRNVLYDDNEVEQLKLNDETWRLSNTVHASSANIAPILSSSDQTVLR